MLASTMLWSQKSVCELNETVCEKPSNDFIPIKKRPNAVLFTDKTGALLNMTDSDQRWDP